MVFLFFYKKLMTLYLLSLSLGFLSLVVIPSLPPLWVLLAFLCFFLILSLKFKKRFFFSASLFLLSFSWSVYNAQAQLNNWIKKDLEGVKLNIYGQVQGLPEMAVNSGQRFVFDIKAISVNKKWKPVSKKVSLFTKSEDVNGGLFLPNSNCYLTVKLKRPHGTVNMGGFDYEAYLLSEHIVATGNVQAFTCDNDSKGIDHIRFSLRQYFLKKYADSSEAGVLLALITGDRDLIPKEVWQAYSETGIVHLMAISGTHITMLAVLMSFLIIGFLRIYTRLFPAIALHFTLYKPSLWCGLALAFLYSLVAGYSIPTERTLIMLVVIGILYTWQWRLSIISILLVTLIVVLLKDPLSVHSSSFWLSFSAVSILIISGHFFEHLSFFKKLIYAQFCLSLLLLPISLWYFDSIIWVAFLANLIAVPVITFLVVPLGLIGFVLWLCSYMGGADFLWHVAQQIIMALDCCMNVLHGWPYAHLVFSLPSSFYIALLLVAIFLVVQPVFYHWKVLSIYILSAIFFIKPALKNTELKMTVLDIGQGLSLLIETAHHRLVYDTGPAYTEGNAVLRQLLPVLHKKNIYHVDGIMLSHDDLDHTGGLEDLLPRLRIDQGLGAWPSRLAQQKPPIPWSSCTAGQEWHWDGWHFEILYPDLSPHLEGDNNKSCVLRISRGNIAALLPGDLEKEGEALLLDHYSPEQLRANVLVLGHHGSKNSSTSAFLESVQPDVGIVSAGYRNHYHHPSQQTIARLDAHGVKWVNTASVGAIYWQVDADGKQHWSCERERAGHYWLMND
jgi:competence protein ComEC